MGIENTSDPNQKSSLPWHIPEELRYFRSKTLGKPIIMGRKTFESIGRLLPKRVNIILSQDKHFQIQVPPTKSEKTNDVENQTTCFIVHSVKEALKLDILKTYDEVMVIGGSKIYAQFLPVATRLYLTTIHDEYEGNVYFPTFDLKDWDLIEEKEGNLFTAKIYQRKHR
jgi:dihydrofolate reductase